MMINWLLKNLGLHAEIDEVLYQKIHDNMMERVQDKVAEIRAQAVTALQRLQVKKIDIIVITESNSRPVLGVERVLHYNY